ncbi:Hypothetical predicted protein, partial [Marmota monax]
GRRKLKNLKRKVKEKILKMYWLQRQLKKLKTFLPQRSKKVPSVSSSVFTWIGTMAMDFSFLSLLHNTLERTLASQILQDKSNRDSRNTYMTLISALKL